MVSRGTAGAGDFDIEAFFPRRIFDRISEIRVDAPEIIEQQAQRRKQRTKLAVDGKLTILAADHPARGVTASGSDPLLMGNRQEYLGRSLRVLTASSFDGFMGTADMIDDLLIIDYLVQQGGGPSFLDDKVLIGCMQRGGVAGAAGEIYDRFTGYTADSIARFRLDGGKMLLRVAYEEERTLQTLYDCALAINALNRLELPAFVEPMRVQYENGRYSTKNTADELIRVAGIASGLGDSSRHLWLKLPYCTGYEQVSLATTLPIILLGGPSREDPRSTFEDFAAGMRAGANVRGAMVGRNILFPGGDDPAAVAHALDDVVHGGGTADEALQNVATYRGRDLDCLTRYVQI